MLYVAESWQLPGSHHPALVHLWPAAWFPARVLTCPFCLNTGSTQQFSRHAAAAGKGAAGACTAGKADGRV